MELQSFKAVVEGIIEDFGTFLGGDLYDSTLESVCSDICMGS